MMKKQNNGKNSSNTSKRNKTKLETLAENKKITEKVENQELTENDILSFDAESSLKFTPKQRQSAKDLTKLLNTYYKNSESQEKIKTGKSKAILKKKGRIKASESEKLDNSRANSSDIANQDAQIDKKQAENDDKSGQPAKDIYTRDDIREESTTIIENNAVEVVENDDTTAKPAIINNIDEYEEYRVGIFKEDKFSSNCSHSSITPLMIYNMLYEYSFNEKPMAAMIKSHLHIDTHDYYRHFKTKFKAIADFGDFCEKMKGKTLIAESIRPFLQNINNMPNVAFKGDHEIEKDSDGNVIGELSSSYAKFNEIRHKALMSHAEIMERGSIEKKQGDIVVNQQQNTTNYESWTVEAMAELNPRDLDL